MAQLSRIPRPWRIGLGVPLLAGVVLAIGAAVSWVSGGYQRPDKIEAGQMDEFAPGAPRLFDEDDVWVVRLDGDRFLALYDRGLESGCPLQWSREFEFKERTGWFEDTCTGSAYDLTGRCFSEGCRGQLLDRFPVTTAGDNVTVDLRALERGLPADASAEPVSP